MESFDLFVDAVVVGGKVVPGTSNNVVSDLTSWSTIVLPDEFVKRGKLVYFSAIFVDMTPTHLQIWRPGNSSDQLTLVYNKKVFPQALNQIETVSKSLGIVSSDYIFYLFPF